MLAHIKLQDETMTDHCDIIDQLDELIGHTTLRIAAHDKFTESQIANRRVANEFKTAYFCITASFIAQRACHTAQANALLLRHGFADQAFERWRTRFNLELVLAHLCSGDKEDRAERCLNATPVELDFLDGEAREFGMDFARPFDDLQIQDVD